MHYSFYLLPVSLSSKNDTFILGGTPAIGPTKYMEYNPEKDKFLLTAPEGFATQFKILKLTNNKIGTNFITFKVTYLIYTKLLHSTIGLFR